MISLYERALNLLSKRLTPDVVAERLGTSRGLIYVYASRGRARRDARAPAARRYVRAAASVDVTLAAVWTGRGAV